MIQGEKNVPPAATAAAQAQAAAERKKREEQQRWYEKEKARLDEERERLKWASAPVTMG